MRTKRSGVPRCGELRLGYFTRSLVTHVANERRIFARHGLTVTELPCTSSAAQFDSLRSGEYDLVVTSPDNVAAYRLSAANPLHDRIDARILFAVDAGLGLSVVAAPGIESLAQLRGRTVAVDVRSSGFAMAMFALLEDAGLRAGTDFEVVELGATPQRREALLSGRCDATLLYAGHDVLAEAAGCRRLARVTDHLHPYLGAVVACTGGWLTAHRTQAQRFADAWRAATGYILDPGHQSQVETAIAERLGLPVDAAAAMYSVFVSERDGLVRDGAVALPALRTVLSTRARYAPSDALGELTDAWIRSSGLLVEQSPEDAARRGPIGTPAITPMSRQVF